MSVDAGILRIVHQAARGFAERHREVLDQMERAGRSVRLDELLVEAAALGWSGSLAADDNTMTGADEAEILGSILYELARHSPALAARILAHHVCRLCCGPVGDSQQESAAGLDFPWLGLSGGLFERRFESKLKLVEDASGLRLRGALAFVVAGDTSSRCVGRIDLPDGDFGIVLVKPKASQHRSAVATLGLHGLGAVDLQFDDLDESGFVLVAQGEVARTRLQLALRLAALGYLKITLAMLESTERIVTEHTGTRRQNGVFLRQLPAVRQQLAKITQSLALTRVTLRANSDPTLSDEGLLGLVSDAANGATDAGLQALGGVGYIVGSGIERLWRDTRQLGHLFIPRAW